MDGLLSIAGKPLPAEEILDLTFEMADELDASSYYSSPVEKSPRFRRNVVFRVAGGNEAIEKLFMQVSAAAGLVGLAGHRSVGGMRV